MVTAAALLNDCVFGNEAYCSNTCRAHIHANREFVAQILPLELTRSALELRDKH
ncbi:Uncharacterised protein [Vibrio cholerae]|nr:Uncharacterised protein [Vibrio cholerae]